MLLLRRRPDSKEAARFNARLLTAYRIIQRQSRGARPRPGPSLQTLDLQGNQFTGQIPASWAGMTSLDNASLANNPGLCTPGDNSRLNVKGQWYGPCQGPSPLLPGISPDYPVSSCV